MSGRKYNADGSGTANDYSNHRPSGHTSSTYPKYDQGKNLEVTPEALNRIADALQDDLDNLLREPLNKVIQIGGGVQAQHMGGSPTAAEVQQVAMTAHQHIGGVYSELGQAYSGVISKLRESAKRYGAAEDQTGQQVDQVGDFESSQPASPAAPASTANSTTANTGPWAPA